MKKSMFTLAVVTLLAINGGVAFAAQGGNGKGHGYGHSKGAPLPLAALGLPLAAGLFFYTARRNKS
ncbi:hypothetical protein ACFFP0_21135 [Rhizobium puerariae]|uniref:Uncharacterized protein n=1 Tax=Rhizobium puerariae TaxID=1585791 RepID=A0ABV6AL62_9HYPH